jgi:hypothetical protein
LASVRNRLFLVIAGMALLASVSIGAVYVATETERIDVRRDLRAVAELYDLTVGLSDAIRNQKPGWTTTSCHAVPQQWSVTAPASNRS